MTRPKIRFPSVSFGPELFAVLREGSLREVRIRHRTKEEATQFAQRLNMLRSSLRHENHPDWENFFRAQVRKDKTDPTTVVVSPRDSQYSKAIADAGISVLPEGNTPPMDTKSAPKTDTNDPAEDFLASLRRGPHSNLDDL